MSLNEVREIKANIGSLLADKFNLDEASLALLIESTKKKVGVYHKNFIIRYIKRINEDRKTITMVKEILKR